MTQCEESVVDYQVSRAALAKLVAYPFPAPDETRAVQMGVTTPLLAAYVDAVVNIAVSRQWAVEVLGDEGVSARMREINHAALNSVVDYVISSDPERLTPEVPPDVPRGTYWEWTGAGWILVVPVVEVVTPLPPPSRDWQGEDLVAIGVRMFQAGQSPPGALLGEELRIGGYRMIDEGMSRLG